MSAKKTLPPSYEVKFFEVDDQGTWKVVQTRPFEFVTTSEPGERFFTVQYKHGIGFPHSEFRLPAELWTYFGEVGAKVTLPCTYDNGASVYGTEPIGCVVGYELIRLT